MKKFLILLVISLLSFSCNNDDDNKRFCNVDNPTEDLQWLKTEISNRVENESEDDKYFYIMQVSHNNKDIFVYGNCHPLINSVSPIFNCKGEHLGNLYDDDFPGEILSIGKVIWKTDNFECDF